MLERFAAEGLPFGPSAHQTLSGNLRTLFKVMKSGCSIDVVAQDRLTGREVAVDNALDGLAQKRVTEIRVALRPRPDGLLEGVG
jgi:hypothetical protein